MSDYEPLWRWAREREAIRVRKELGDPFPWTDDPILRAYRFCNVRREDDRVTVWVRESVREPFADHPLLWLMLAVARAVNWPPTLAELIRVASDPEDHCASWPSREDFDPEHLEWVLSDRAARGEKVFTGAYVITAPKEKGASKASHVARSTVGALWRSRDRFAKVLANPNRTMRVVHNALMDHDGWGPFMAYQVVVDIRYTRLLEGAPDARTWAAAGPGTVRGLNRLHGLAVDATMSQGRALQLMLPIFERIADATGVGADLSDVPNVLCEFDKYERVRLGEGAPRARYVPGRGS